MLGCKRNGSTPGDWTYVFGCIADEAVTMFEEGSDGMTVTCTVVLVALIGLDSIQ
jgi:hypothetical protein